MNRFAKKFHSLALALALGLGPAALAADQAGRLKGKVVDAESKQVLAGAKVTLSSPALIGGKKVIATGPDGVFEVPDLPPGEYTVELSYEGVQPLTRKAVVRQGETTPLAINWQLESDMQAEIDVEAEMTMTRAESTQAGTVTTSATQNRLASGRTYQTVAQQTAGVSGGGNPNVRGANLLMNRYLIDGLDITDPVTNTFSANVNFDSIASMAIITGGMEAEYNSMGGVINLVTATGSNDFHVDASVQVNHYLLSAPTQYGSNAYDGVRPFPAPDAIRPPTQSYQANFNLSGPIVKDTLWYNGSVQYGSSESSNPSGPPLNLQATNRKFNNLYLRGKLSFAPTSAHRVTLSAFADPTNIPYVDNNGGLANSVTPLAARQQNQGGPAGTLLWEWFLDDSTTVNAQFGTQKSIIESGPVGKFSKGVIDFNGTEGKYLTTEYDYNRPRHTNLDDGTAWYNGANYQLDSRYTYAFDTSLAKRGVLFGQRHQAKVGLQTRVLHRTRELELPGGYNYSDRGGGPGEAGLCNPETGEGGCYTRTRAEAYNIRQQGYGFGIYAQDRWNPTEWLTLLPGLRFDWGRTKDAAGRLVGQLYGFGPRFGAVFDITRDQKTVFSASYGRSNETLSLLAASTASPAAVQITEQFDPATKSWNFLRQSGGASGTFSDTSTHTPPHSDEILLSLRRQIFKNTGLSAEYTFKQISNVWTASETNHLLDPTGTRIIGYANGTAQNITKLERPDNNWVRYQSVDLILDGRPTPDLEFYAAYTLSFRYGPGNDEIYNAGFNVLNWNWRQHRFYDGYALGDTRHQIKLQGSYQFGDLSIGPSLSFSTGEPLPRFHTIGSSSTLGSVLRSPMGTQTGTPNDYRSISEFRSGDVLNANARVNYNLERLTGQKIQLSADAFNLLNMGAASYRTSDVTSFPNTFGTVSSRQQPFRVQLGLRYQY